MKAMIFAAGLGTRLRPLTNNKPKALVKVGDMPLLEITIRRLKQAGFRELVVNVHHFANQIVQFLEDHHHFGCQIDISDERELLLDTGGALYHARDFLRGAPFLVHNVDVLTDLDLQAFYQAHLQRGGLATLAVQKRPASRQLLFDDDFRLSGWRDTRNDKEVICREGVARHPFSFSGLHVVDPALLDHMTGDRKVFSIIDFYLDVGKKEALYGYDHSKGVWLDAGKVPALEKAERILPRLDLD